MGSDKDGKPKATVVKLIVEPDRKNRRELGFKPPPPPPPKNAKPKGQK